MKQQNLTHSLVAVETYNLNLSQIIVPERYSSSHRLFRVTAFVLKFISCVRRRIDHTEAPAQTCISLTKTDLDKARLYWIKDAQLRLQEDKRFPTWKGQLGLFIDRDGVWRCGGRMSKSCLSIAEQNPVLLDKKHYLATLMVMDAHKHVLHNGVKETLTQLRSVYWLVRGRQFVRKLIHSCVVCRKLEGKHCRGIPPPPLPEFRVVQSRPFQTTGVDFAGPLHVKSSNMKGTTKVWLCLYTCCATRAVHLDLVPDMTATSFLRNLKRFTARRGVPSRMISDNAKTFKSAATSLHLMLRNPEVKKYFSQFHIDWKFNLEKAPWWGGIFEHMIKSAKRCLGKAIGRNCLTYDELLTLITEVEAVLNSRPLTYVSSEDLEEPLTPSHLLVGYRILSLPDPSAPDDDDYSSGTLTRRNRHLLKTLKRFWRRWKREYLLELREFHRDQDNRGIVYNLKKGDIVTVYDEGHPRGLWRLGKIEDVIQSADGGVRGVIVKVTSRKGHVKHLRRPIQHIYPLDICHDSPTTKVNNVLPTDNGERELECTQPDDSPMRPVRRAAVQARDRIVGCLTED